jgi:tungstate transport system ATP-binding protein
MIDSGGERRVSEAGGEPQGIYELENLVVAYGGRTVLDLPHGSIPRGGVVGLIGPNGSGKSTLLKVLAFLLPPTSGILRFDGEVASPGDPALRRRATLLLQEPYLLKRTVFENVAYGLRVRGEKGVEVPVREALFSVGLEPRRFEGRSWYALSGGEAQRVALAARLVLRPDVLLLDEPTSSVDEASAVLIQEAALRAVSERGMTLVMATHDLSWLYGVSGTILHLWRGRVVGDGAENLIPGPWEPDEEGRVRHRLASGRDVWASPSPGPGAAAVLNPSDVSVALEHPQGISARNRLPGTILHMTLENGSGRILISVDAEGWSLKARVTREAVAELGLHPGLPVWAVFKASSIRWV